MSRAIILQHVPHEGPGRIVPVFGDFGIKLDIRHLYKGDEVPTDLDEVRTLIVEKLAELEEDPKWGSEHGERHFSCDLGRRLMQKRGNITSLNRCTLAR